MGSYLVEKYASLVNADIIISLFRKLTQYYGDSRTKAADECRITRKAVYDWDSLKEEIKLSTRQKVLEQAIEHMPVETLGYLTKQMHDSSSDLLMSYLSTIYEKAFDATKNKTQFMQLTQEFEQALKNYAGLVYKKLDYEVDDMSKELATLANQHSINWKPTPFHLYDSEDLKKTIPQIINSWIYYGLPQTPEELAERLKVPTELVHMVGETLNREFYTLSRTPPNKLRSSGVEIGYYIAGNEKTMLSAAARPVYKTDNEQEALPNYGA